MASKIDADSPQVFFEAVFRQYQKAVVSGAGEVERFYLIAGFPVCLRFAGRALLKYITPALEHLAIEPVAEVMLTVCLWDCESTNTSMIPPAWGAEDQVQRGEIRSFTNERFSTVFDLGTRLLSILDRQRNLAIFWVKKPRDIPYYEMGAPLRTIFHLWLSKKGVQLIHAGAVGTAKGGVLLVGKGGSGKSTTALACLNSELFYSGDDYCLLAPDPSPTVFSLYCTGKKNADDLERLPFLGGLVSNYDRLDREKALYFLSDYFGEKFLLSFPLRAILIPRISGETNTSLKEASSAQALAALAPSSIFQLAGAGEVAFARMAKTVKQVSCYYLNLGSDIKQIPDVISGLLEGY